MAAWSHQDKFCSLPQELGSRAQSMVHLTIGEWAKKLESIDVTSLSQTDGRAGIVAGRKIGGNAGTERGSKVGEGQKTYTSTAKPTISTFAP